ncbi:MAG: hypothetical protein ABIN89_29080, partial [Chitinophagaceae bacterium]
GTAQSTGKEYNSSDKRFFIKAYGGYGIFTPGSYRLQTSTTNTYTVNNISRDSTIFSLGKKGLGKGLRLGGGVGYIINNLLTIGVDFESLESNQLNANISRESSNNTFRSNAITSFSHKNVMTIIPHVIFKARSSSNYFLYTKLGVLISFPFDMDYSYIQESSDSTAYSSTTTTQTTTDTYTNTSKQSTVATYKVPTSFGLNVALGAQFTIKGNLRGFVEAFANYTVLAPSSYKGTNSYLSTRKTVNTTKTSTTNTTKTDINITSQHNTYDYSFIKDGSYVYVNQSSSTTPTVTKVGTTTTTTYTYNYNYNNPQSQTYRNMHAIGLNIGLSYRF